ncbi:MAG: hypothetical protein UU67_C0018G0011 [Candidatus Daviesbacteria bacterium GW2011_GWB1_41_5]|uniref:Uncharacterized protein n=1 Tax=Candidatus Daviesbacteria bacterium GW2011_GWB1_41_5 TaxID=1618429 RepID=A0A0G0WLW6_9BACT|nr:MAG: hypothetical protein UU67_C0018G0011 [Candidatus Daviesbacteria bacterium GW2011_GWB1_41_5]
MNTPVITFSYKIIIHSFDGFATDIEGFGVIHPENDKTPSLPEETIISLIRLAQIVRPIHMRMLASGYNISNGKLVKSEPKV